MLLSNVKSCSEAKSVESQYCGVWAVQIMNEALALVLNPSLAWETPWMCFLCISMPVHTEHLSVWSSACLLPIYSTTTPPFHTYSVKECVSVWVLLAPVRVLAFCMLIRSEWMLFVMGSIVDSATTISIHIPAIKSLSTDWHKQYRCSNVCVWIELSWEVCEETRKCGRQLWQLITDGSFVLSTGHAV